MREKSPYLTVHLSPSVYGLVALVLQELAGERRTRPTADALHSLLGGLHAKFPGPWPGGLGLDAASFAPEHAVYERGGEPAAPIAWPEPPPARVLVSGDISLSLEFDNPADRDRVQHMLTGGERLGPADKGRAVGAACLVALLLEPDWHARVGVGDLMGWTPWIWPDTAPSALEWEEWLVTV
jgi:hypothetical protein